MNIYKGVCGLWNRFFFYLETCLNIDTKIVLKGKVQGFVFSMKIKKKLVFFYGSRRLIIVNYYILESVMSYA